MSTQTALSTIHNIPKTKTDLPYREAWASRYSDLEPVFCDNVKPLDCALAHTCLEHIKKCPGAYKGRTGALLFTLFLMPFNPTSKIDQGLIEHVETWRGSRVLPFGDVYYLAKGKRPSVKTALGILMFLARELDGRLLSDKEGRRWSVIIL